jgi:hypothetical protein
MDSAKKAQGRADFEYCAEGLEHCLNTRCGCANTRFYRREFIRAWIRKNKENK